MSDVEDGYAQGYEVAILRADKVIARLEDRIALLEAAIRKHREVTLEVRGVGSKLDKLLYAVLQEDKPHE